MENLLLKKKTVLAVVFLLGASVFNLIFFSDVKQLQAQDHLLGGPTEMVVDDSGYVILKDASVIVNNNPSIDSDITNTSDAIATTYYKIIESLPDLGSYFSIPTSGWNWGQLHNYNAVDIANACGTPIYAAAEGVVSESVEAGWNDGYGSYLLIKHSNNTSTKYAHNSKNLVSVGQYVLRGDRIAYIGNTGNTHGPTGCHLHFEVRGARNPFAKK